MQKSRMLWRAHGAALRDEALTEDHLREAKRLLEQFDFVGTTETFEEDSTYLYGRLGLQRFHDRSVVNAGPPRATVSEASRRLIGEYNALDRELYEFAKRRRSAIRRERRANW